MNEEDNAGIERTVSNSELIETLGAVLTYVTDGYGGVGGQQVGADGRGEYAVIFTGEPDKADAAARDYYKKLVASGSRIKQATIVANYEGYYGMPITIIDCP